MPRAQVRPHPSLSRERPPTNSSTTSSVAQTAPRWRWEPTRPPDGSTTAWTESRRAAVRLRLATFPAGSCRGRSRPATGSSPRFPCARPTTSHPRESATWADRSAVSRGRRPIPPSRSP
jgi:hypothetical protein